MLVLNFLSYVTSGFANEHRGPSSRQNGLNQFAYLIVLRITNNHVKLNRLLLGGCYLYIVPA